MRTLHSPLALAALLASFTACSAEPGSPGAPAVGEPGVQMQNGSGGLQGKPEPGDGPMLGLHAARGSGGGSSTTPGNMTFHDGAILNDAQVTAIFWGTSWGTSSFVGDKVDGLDRLYGNVGGSAYAGTNTEYTGTNGQVGTSVTYHGHLVDTSAGPLHAPRTSAILAEVCKMIANPVADGYYPVYTDLKRGSASYCAWHSYGTCGTTPVQFGFFFNLDGDSSCDPLDTSTKHSQGLAALANVTGHELSETLTDPRNGGWYDQQQQENGDKCAWTFPTTNVVLGTESWKIQGNWSNAAFTAGTGYANSKAQLGCIPNY